MAEDQGAQKQNDNTKPLKPQGGNSQQKTGNVQANSNAQPTKKKRRRKKKKRPDQQFPQGEQKSFQKPKQDQKKPSRPKKQKSKSKSLEDLVLGTSEESPKNKPQKPKSEPSAEPKATTEPETYDISPPKPKGEDVLPPPPEEPEPEPTVEPEAAPAPSEENLNEDELLGMPTPSEEAPELPEAPQEPETVPETQEVPESTPAAPAAPEPVQEPKEPSPFHMEEKPKGPVGWDQLKDAIKKDYEETEGGVAPIPVPTPTEAEPTPELTEKPKEPEPVTEVVQEAPVETEPEIIEPETVEQPSPVAPKEALEEDEAERKEVIRIIIKYVIRGCAVIAILLAIFLFKLPQLIYGGVVDFIYGDDQTQISQTDDISDQVAQPSGEYTDSLITLFVAGSNKGTSLEKFEEGIQTIFVTGEEIPQIKRISSGIQAVFDVGLPEAPEDKTDRIATYIQVLSKLQNAFSTDIHQLLDNSSDRQKTLELHLDELNQAQEEAISTLAAINERKDALKIQFNEVTTLKEQYEDDFFASMEQLEATKANTLLNEFISVSQEQIDLKAEYNSLSKAAEMFEIATANMEARIKDIEYNKAALIRGVKVVDIKGSDLDLIIHEEEI